MKSALKCVAPLVALAIWPANAAASDTLCCTSWNPAGSGALCVVGPACGSDHPIALTYASPGACNGGYACLVTSYPQCCEWSCQGSPSWCLGDHWWSCCGGQCTQNEQGPDGGTISMADPVCAALPVQAAACCYQDSIVVAPSVQGGSAEWWVAFDNFIGVSDAGAIEAGMDAGSGSAMDVPRPTPKADAAAEPMPIPDFTPHTQCHGQIARRSGGDWPWGVLVMLLPLARRARAPGRAAQARRDRSPLP